MNKAELVSEIASRTKGTKKDAEAFLDAFCVSVKDAMVRGEKVTLVGFGKFSTAVSQGRTGRNPRTGEPISIPAITRVKFSVGKDLAKAVNQ